MSITLAIPLSLPARSFLKALIAGVVSACMGSAASPASAYERATHAALTQSAVGRSNLTGSGDLLGQLGLTLLDPTNPFGNQYYDTSAITQYLRTADDPQFDPSPYEARLIKDLHESSLSITGWIMRGSIREDDTPRISNARENNPQDDLFGTRFRVLHHFFDPYHNVPLSGPVVDGACAAEFGCKRSPDWALGSTDAFDIHAGPNANRTNHFSIVDAHEAVWRAITGTRSNDNHSVAQNAAERLTYWATAFRTLGDVVHHIQDMAQPQHSRNDPHAGAACVTSSTCLGGHASYYELYIDARATGELHFAVGEQSVEIPAALPSLPLDQQSYPYANPSFARFSDYWSTGQQSASLTGMGLADYSSRGFFSAGTNIGSAKGLTFPKPDVAELQDAPVDNAVNLLGKRIGTLAAKAGSVQDYVTNTADSRVLLTSNSAFDPFLIDAGKQPVYSLNYYNYDDQARLLLPRAAAYSAGLINFFFRGKMTISLPDEGIYGIVDHSQFGPTPATPTNVAAGFMGFGKIRLKLTNATPPVTPPNGATVNQAMPGGTLVAVLKFHRNLCYSDNLDGELTAPSGFVPCRSATEEIVVSDPKTNQLVPLPGDPNFPNGREIAFTFPKQLPINAWDVWLQVIYRGPLGSENDDVVVATKDISEPIFIATYNDSDFVLIAGACVPASSLTPSNPLWSQLTSACQGSGAVSPQCANLGFNARYTLGTNAAQVTVAMDTSSPTGSLQAGRFGRFAVLGDAASQLASSIGFANPPLVFPQGNPAPVLWSLPSTEQQSLTTSTAAIYHRSRSINNLNDMHIVVDGKTATVGNICPVTDLSPLQNAARYPQPLTITGWN